MVGRIQIPKIGVDQMRRGGRRTSTTSARGPGTTRARRCPGTRATPRSPATARRTAHRSATSTSSRPATRSGGHAVQGDFHYKVTEQRVVDPSEVSVLDPTPDPAGPVTTSRPSPSPPATRSTRAEQRLIVKAQLAALRGQTAPLPPTKVKGGAQATTIGGLSGESSSRHRRSSGARSRVGDRPAVVAAVPPPPALDDVVVGVRAVPRRAVRRLHVPRAAAAVELLSRAATTRRSAR